MIVYDWAFTFGAAVGILFPSVEEREELGIEWGVTLLLGILMINFEKVKR